MTEKKHKSLSLTTAHNGLIIQIRRIVLEHGKGRRRCRVAATIKDIAAAAGVSRGTVDRVLHGRGGVCPEVRERSFNWRRSSSTGQTGRRLGLRR